jgi:hypothetical protein
MTDSNRQHQMDRKQMLAHRREQLMAECSAQRTAVSREIGGLRAPSVLMGGSLMDTLGRGNLKVPLTIAGVVLGMVAMRPGRFMPLIAAGLPLLKMAMSVISMVRKTPA